MTWASRSPSRFRCFRPRGGTGGRSASRRGAPSTEIEHEGTSVDNTDVFEDLDAVYQFTAGYLRDSGARSLFLEARYQQGLTSIGKTDRSTVGDLYVVDFKSTGLRLVAGILF